MDLTPQELIYFERYRKEKTQEEVKYKAVINQCIESARKSKSTKFKFILMNPEDAKNRMFKQAMGMIKEYDKHIE